MDFSWVFNFGDPVMWVAIALLAFAGVIVYLKVPGTITKSLDERADKIRDELDQARLLREEAQELLASYTRKARTAEKKAEAIIAQAKTEAKLYAEETRTKLTEQLQRRADAAERRIEQAQAQAEALVRDKAVDLAVKAAETAITNSVPKTTKTKLVDAGIKDMQSSL
ncbi:ATP synthase F0 sector subunit b [hydrothermal vent metagenome]|uniref:ATP synthase F0 sector subunit b n=1 Tax=hydrothermal vent metagenome TaxID=652676 RepID=A0A3B0RZ28_9ZZZZ